MSESKSMNFEFSASPTLYAAHVLYNKSLYSRIEYCTVIVSTLNVKAGKEEENNAIVWWQHKLEEFTFVKHRHTLNYTVHYCTVQYSCEQQYCTVEYLKSSAWTIVTSYWPTGELSWDMQTKAKVGGPTANLSVYIKLVSWWASNVWPGKLCKAKQWEDIYRPCQWL